MVQIGSYKTVRAIALKINRKNIYRQQSKQEEKDRKLKEQIHVVHKQHPAYGYRRVALALERDEEQIRRVMKKYGIKPPRRKTKSYYCTRSVAHRKYANLIKGYMPTKPHELWCSDVSFIKFQGKFWYLLTIIDITTRQIIGADIGKKHDSALVLRGIKQAMMATKQMPKIFHSDQGTEFMAKDCTNYLKKLGVKISASDKASPWQNGYQESFFGRFKDEFGYINRFETIGELIEEIYQQIHYYNNERIHTSLSMPPAIFAKRFS